MEVRKKRDMLLFTLWLNFTLGSKLDYWYLILYLKLLLNTNNDKDVFNPI